MTPNVPPPSNTALKIGTPDGVAVARTLIRFANMQGLLYTKIDSATLSLYQVGANTCTATEFDLYEGADEFTDSTTWDTQPPVGAMFASAAAAKGYPGCAAGTVTLSTGGAGGHDLADLVQGWADGDANNGMVIEAADESSTNHYKKFNSSEAGSDVPSLSVTYEDRDINELLSNEWLDEDTLDDIVATDPDNADPDVVADCPSPTYTITESVGFKDLNGTDSLHADVYAPPTAESGDYFPVMILVHGGGFIRGCKHNVQKEAAVAAGLAPVDGTTYLPQKFLVFNINYRLACRTSSTYLTLATETNGEIESNAALCGWHFTDTDTTGHDGFTYGAAVHDVEDAVAWIRDHPNHVNSWCPEGDPGCWNDKIELVGNSAGGNLAYEAVGRMGPKSETNPYQVDAVGSWSGPLRISYLDELNANNEPIWPCQKSQTKKFKTCRNAERQYVGCDATLYPPETQSCIDDYVDASPYDHFTDPGLPRAFFSNGRPYGPLSTDPDLQDQVEVISRYSAGDLSENLHTIGWGTSAASPTGVYRYCRVDIDLHGKTYIYGYGCMDEPDEGTVYVNMVEFLRPAVCESDLGEDCTWP